MDVVLASVIRVVAAVIELYIWIIVINAVLSWLIAFNVVNTSNRLVYMIGDFTYRITEPALRPIRRIIPNLGGIDISPVVLILLLILVKDIILGFLWKYGVAG
jgi:YggT family protein